MALAETAELAVRLSLDNKFNRQLKSAEGALGGFTRKLNSSGDRWYRAGTQIGTGIKRGVAIGVTALGVLGSQVVAGIRSLSDLEQQQAQTNAAIKSTGGVAGVTAAEVGRLSEKYEALNATIGDETIREAQNLLLTFTNVRKEAFEPALEAALDLNQRLGRGPDGLANTMRVVGRALNDPAKGLAQLTRLGVTFTDQQQDQIKTLLRQNDTLGAQRVILDELEKRFGGSFAAAGDTGAAALAAVADAGEDLQRALALGVYPALGKVARRISQELTDPAVVAKVTALGEKIGALFTDENMDRGVRLLKQGFDAAVSAAPALISAAQQTARIVGTAVNIFRSLPPEIQKLAIGAFAINKLTGGLVTNVVGGLAGKGLSIIFEKGGSPANPLWVSMVGGGVGAGAAGAAGAATSKVGRALNVIGKVAVIGAALFALKELHDIRAQQSEANRKLGEQTARQAVQFADRASLTDLSSSLNGIEAYTQQLQAGLTPEAIAYQLNIDGVRDRLDQVKATLQGQITALTQKQQTISHAQTERMDSIRMATQEQTRKTSATITAQTAAQRVASVAAGIRAAMQYSAETRTKAAIDTTRGAVQQTRGAVNSGTSRIVSALYATRPVVRISSTTVVNSANQARNYTNISSRNAGLQPR